MLVAASVGHRTGHQCCGLKFSGQGRLVCPQRPRRQAANHHRCQGRSRAEQKSNRIRQVRNISWAGRPRRNGSRLCRVPSTGRQMTQSSANWEMSWPDRQILLGNLHVCRLPSGGSSVGSSVSHRKCKFGCGEDSGRCLNRQASLDDIGRMMVIFSQDSFAAVVSAQVRSDEFRLNILSI